MTRSTRVRWQRTMILACGLLITTAGAVFGEVVRVEIAERGLVAGGKQFGSVGQYEKLEGTIYFQYDPLNKANASIVDLALASKNKNGRVEAHGDLVVLQPLKPERGSGTALLEVSNRGGKASLRYYNSGNRGDLSEPGAYGDGFLMRRGLTIIWVGWQFDVPDEPSRLRLHVPEIEGVTGLARSDWTVDEETDRLELAHRNHIPYDLTGKRTKDDQLTERDGRLSPRRTIPRGKWNFTRDGKGIRREEGFSAGKIYELVYSVRNPSVVGLGLAAIRDTMSYARYSDDSPFKVKRGFALGISQTGRFLRHFLYQGFNSDEKNRKVFDGIFAATAGAGRGSFNHRFAQPSRDAHRYSAFFYPTDLFPFTGRPQRDPQSERRGGLLDRTLASGHMPKVFYQNSGYEYWGRAASLIHTSLDGSADVEPLADVRIYHLASCQHFPFGFNPESMPPITGARANLGNPIDFLTLGRALVVAMQDWIERGVAPPPSSFPRIDEETLVPINKVAFPSIPGIQFPNVIHEAYRADYGKQFADGIISRQPPGLGAAFPSLVSQVDADGNELGGIRPIEIQVPLATYTPWHLRQGLAGGNGELTDFWGMILPFNLDEKSRVESGDPRPSLAERYETRNDYLAQVTRAARGAVLRRHLLLEDIPRVVKRAGELWDWAVTR